MLERARRRLRSAFTRWRTGPHCMKMIGMVAVLARDGRGQPSDESRFGLARHLLEAVRRQVMALVDDQMAVVARRDHRRRPS